MCLPDINSQDRTMGEIGQGGEWSRRDEDLYAPTKPCLFTPNHILHNRNSHEDTFQPTLLYVCFVMFSKTSHNTCLDIHVLPSLYWLRGSGSEVLFGPLASQSSPPGLLLPLDLHGVWLGSLNMWLTWSKGCKKEVINVWCCNLSHKEVVKNVVLGLRSDTV